MSFSGTSANPDAMNQEFFANDEAVISSLPALSEVDPRDFPFAGVEWTVQAAEPLDLISNSLISFRDVAEDVNRQQQILSIGIGTIVLLSAIGVFFALRYTAGQITKPVEQLSVQAQRAADIGIPAVVEAARTSDELPHLDEFNVETDDELAILAASLNTMQDAAVDLAAGQAQLRRQNVSRTFVSLDAETRTC